MTAPTTNVLTQLVQALLPRSLYGKAKAVVATVTALGSAVLLLLPYFTDVPTQVGGIIGTVLALLAPVGVYLTSNETAAQPEHSAESAPTAGADLSGDA